jgi:hypothetical protein
MQWLVGPTRSVNGLSVEIHGLLAFVAALCTAEKLMPAGRADVSTLLLGHPLLRAVVPPVGNGPKDHLLSHGHREILDMRARKLLALMAAVNAFLPCTVLYCTNPAEIGDLIGEAAPALEIFNGQVFESGYRGLVKIQKLFKEPGVVVPGGVIDAADPAVETAGRKKGFIAHCSPPIRKPSNGLPGLADPPWQGGMGLLLSCLHLENGKMILILVFTVRQTEKRCRQPIFDGALKMILKIKSYIFFGLLATVVAAAGLFMKAEHGAMALAEKMQKSPDEIPLIDRRAPSGTETATFALG